MNESALGMRVHLEHESTLGCMRVHLEHESALRCLECTFIMSALGCMNGTCECTRMNECTRMSGVHFHHESA